MNIWHDISEDFVKPNDFTAVIEISKGGKNKYELDKQTGMLRLDRVLYTATHYPHNYGFIPRTLASDGDPLDVLVMCQEAIAPMTLVQVYPIGVMKMTDGNDADEKIIAVPFKDPSLCCYTDISQLPNHTLEELRHFFTVYKMLENKTTAVHEILGADKAIEIVSNCIEIYKKKYD
ncbi:MAG: inorganic diphosphatase [Clostridia bacterium]|nr:inorganic diphosphatase [Clostridia bacterium]